MGLTITPKRFGKKLTTFVAVFALAVQPLYALAVAHAAVAAPTSVATTSAGFNSVGWSKDRTMPYAYSKVADKLTFTVNNTVTSAPNSTTFYKWEGFQSSAFPTSTNTVRASLFVDPAWQAKPVSASMWGVSTDGTNTGWPILAFSNGYTGSYDDAPGGFVGFRVYDTNTGLWTNVLPAASFWNTTVDLEITVNPYTQQYEFYVNGTKIYSYGTNGLNSLKGVIFNNLNLKTDNAADNYYVKWTNFYTGQLKFAPELLSTADGAIYRTADLPQTQTWTALEGATKYRYESYTEDPTLNPAAPVFHSEQRTTTSRTLGATAPEGKYWWRVKAVAPYESQWSDARTFVIDNTAPAKPSLVGPSNNAIVNGTSITQSWSNTSSDVDHYVYESYHNATATSLRWHEEFAGTSKTATDVTNGTTYWWRVKAVDHAGNESPWSDLWKLTVDNTTPSISKILINSDTVAGQYRHDADCSPLNGLLQLSGNVNLTAVANDNSGVKSVYYEIRNLDDNGCTHAEVYNSGPIALNQNKKNASNWNQDGAFDTAAAGLNGKYAVVLVAEDAAGNKTTKYVHLNFNNPVPPTDDGDDGETGSNNGGDTPGNTGGNTSDDDSDMPAPAVVPDLAAAIANAVNALAQQIALQPAGTPAQLFAAAADGNTAVLGVETEDSDTGKKNDVKDSSDILGATAAPDENSNIFASLAWYWWLIIAAVVAGGGWWFVAARRRRGAGDDV